MFTPLYIHNISQYIPLYHHVCCLNHVSIHLLLPKCHFHSDPILCCLKSQFSQLFMVKSQSEYPNPIIFPSLWGFHHENTPTPIMFPENHGPTRTWRTDFQFSDDDAVDKPLLPLALPEGDALALDGVGNSWSFSGIKRNN